MKKFSFWMSLAIISSTPVQAQHDPYHDPAPPQLQLKDPNTMSNAELKQEVKDMKKIQRQNKRIGARKDRRSDRLLSKRRPRLNEDPKPGHNRRLVRGGRLMEESEAAYQKNNEAFSQEMDAKKVQRIRDEAGAGGN